MLKLNKNCAIKNIMIYRVFTSVSLMARCIQCPFLVLLLHTLREVRFPARIEAFFARHQGQSSKVFSV